jgi:hypothetical protein
MLSAGALPPGAYRFWSKEDSVPSGVPVFGGLTLPSQWVSISPSGSSPQLIKNGGLVREQGTTPSGVGQPWPAGSR